MRPLQTRTAARLPSGLDRFQRRRADPDRHIDRSRHPAEMELPLSNQLERQNEQPELFAADIILPSQFFEGIGGKSLSAEQRLMLAVLVDAINVCQGWHRYPSARKRRDFAEAGKWIATGGDAPFSFDNICDALNINSEMLRERLAGLVMGQATQDHFGGSRAMRLRATGRSQNLTPNRARRRKRHVSAGAAAFFLVSAPAPVSERSAVKSTE